MNSLIKYITTLLALIVISCSEITEFSPYDTEIKSTNLNNFYTENLNEYFVENDTLTFAFLSDPHFYYDRLASAVSSINKHRNIAFVVACGDITDSGMTREYQYYWKQMSKLHFPVVSVIGNHDCLSNGYTVYRRMFGDPNFSFLCGDYKFIAFNSVVWENNNQEPEFNWLKNEVETSDQKCLILTHIPPWGDQYTKAFCQKYYDIASMPQVILNLHGHEHRYQDTTVNNKRYIVAEAVYQYEYYLIHLTGDKAEVETIKF